MRYLVGHRAELSGHYSYMALRDVLTQEMRKAVDVMRGRRRW